MVDGFITFFWSCLHFVGLFMLSVPCKFLGDMLFEGLGSFLSIAATTALGYHWYGTAFAITLCGATIIANLGSPINLRDTVNANELRRRHGLAFDIIGLIMFLGGSAVVTFQCFFE